MIKNFAKTKILATIGPATDSFEQLNKLVDAGVDGFRLNFSHGSYDYFSELFVRIKDVCKEKFLPIPILVDLQGPKIRIGELEKDEAYLDSGDEIEITTEEVKGTSKLISTSYKNLAKEVFAGETILLDDGLIELQVETVSENSIKCRIVKGGVLKPRKGMNLPGSKLKVPSLTEKDYADLEYAFQHRVDFIALSFVRTAKDITTLRDWMDERGKKSFIIAKIEKPEAVKNFDEILSVADGIMVARGDLGVEMRTCEIPAIQKKIIGKCKASGKLVITATQMFESMVKNPVPTRAEATDVANAVWDGTDVVMLSAETSVGSYPIDAVKIMNDILSSTENETKYYYPVEFDVPNDPADNIFDSTGKAISNIANQIDATLIVVFTHFGRKAKVISKFDPKAPIIAMSDKFETLNQLNLHSGIYPIYNESFEVEETAIDNAMKILKENELIKKDDLILFTSGAPITDKSRGNWTRFVIV